MLAFVASGRDEYAFIPPIAAQYICRMRERGTSNGCIASCGALLPRKPIAIDEDSAVQDTSVIYLSRGAEDGDDLCGG